MTFMQEHCLLLWAFRVRR